MKNLSILFILISVLLILRSRHLSKKATAIKPQLLMRCENSIRIIKTISINHFETKGEDDNGAPIDVVIFNPSGKSLKKPEKESQFCLSITAFIQANQTESMQR
jgi:hypothetical protein